MMLLMVMTMKNTTGILSEPVVFFGSNVLISLETNQAVIKKNPLKLCSVRRGRREEDAHCLLMLS